MEEDEEEKKLIRETIARVTPELDEKAKKLQEEVLFEIVNNGKSLKEAMHVSDQMIEYMYSQAYQAYKFGKYKDSINFFQALNLINPMDIRFPMGIAASYHMDKQYKKAIEWYTVCAALDEETPVPYYHISDCFFKINKRLSALVSLKMMQVRMGDDPQYTAIKERSLRMIETLSEELDNHTIVEEPFPPENESTSPQTGGKSLPTPKEKKHERSKMR